MQVNSDALRETEIKWLMDSLATSIASLGYPVGMGMAPSPEHLRHAATMLLERCVGAATTPDTLFSRLANELPPGAEVYVSAKNGVWELEAYDWDGDAFEGAAHGDTLEQQARAALAWCLERERAMQAGVDGPGRDALSETALREG